MQYSAVAVLALAATATASYSNETVVYTTEVHTAYTTVCPAATELTYNGVTYTATESETLTITNCPCTIVKPVTTSSAVYCSTWYPYTVSKYMYPTANATTVAAVPTYPAGTAAPTVAPTATPTPSPITASGANKVFALSGASLAGLLGLAAYLL
ncbi:putative clock-controlled protein 6 [Leptodontidium sp. MPI-SDFR-AT-0119]|nr:putative clock-controlled protein 6 [Leptodontidium sp. MPI-SDFR-AT-0119]